MAPAGVFSPVPGVSGRVALSAARCTSPKFASASTPGLPCGMGVGMFAWVVLGGVAVRSPGALRFAAPTPGSAVVLRRKGRGLLRPFAATAGSSQEEVSNSNTPPPPPRKDLFSRMRELAKLLLEEVKKDLSIAVLSYREGACATYATTAIGICEKAEKCFNFAWHFVPIAVAIWTYIK